MIIDGIVVVRFDENGEIGYHVCGQALRVFIVDERVPEDRVYEWLPRCNGTDIREIIPEGCIIGSSQDERHAAIAHVIGAIEEGRPHLSIVDPTP